MKQLLWIPLLAAAVMATPSKMWLGTYSIENYAGNKSDSILNLSWTNDQASSFYAKAYKYLRICVPPKVTNLCL